MGSPLPPIAPETFAAWLGETLDDLPGGRSIPDRPRLAERLAGHYQELRRWNPRLSLVGPGTATEVLTRHYGESLAALPLLDPSDRVLVDLGSGAGFPGLVLAAVRDDLDVYLIEARQRKWAFLRTSVGRCGLSCRCLDARVGRSLPSELPDRIDVVTSRAVALPRSFFEAVLERSPTARFLLWQGDPATEVAEGLTDRDLRIEREVPLAGSHRRRIVELRAR